MIDIPNYHARGNTQPHSIIDKYGVGSMVLELHSKGSSYQEISNAIWEKHSVRVSKMAISRYLSRDRRGDIEANTIYTSIDAIRERVISKSLLLYEDYNRMFEEIKTIIDTSRMQSTDKLAVKRILEAKQKTILQEFTSNRGELGMIFEAVLKNEDGVNSLLMEFSRSMCPQCRKKVVEAVVRYERTAT
jgi:hypothetical protein